MLYVSKRRENGERKKEEKAEVKESRIRIDVR